MNEKACFVSMLLVLHKMTILLLHGCNNPNSITNHRELCANLSSREGASQAVLLVACLAEAYQVEAFPGPSCVVASQEEACDLQATGRKFARMR